MQDILEKAGLTAPQAKAYEYLLASGSSAPPAVAKALDLTRTNAYKVLDSLVDLDLATKEESAKKFLYTATDPVALATLVANERNRINALENNVSDAIAYLRTKYNTPSSPNNTVVEHGAVNIINQFNQQAEIKRPIYFVKTRADIPNMGFETMERIRKNAIQYQTPRFGITPDAPEAPKNPNIDKATLLTRTWIPAEDYTSPVEWSVSGNNLLIAVYQKEPYIIRLSDSVVAESFLQLWKMLDKNIRAQKDYKKFPKKAARQN